MSPLGDEEIDVAIVIRVTGADSLPPAEVAYTGFGGDVLKAKSSQVVIEVRHEGRPCIVQPVALNQEDIREAVVVVIEDRNAGTRIFDDVGLIEVAGDHRCREPGLRPKIAEVRDRRFHAGGKRAHRLISGISGSHLGKQLHSDQRRHSDRDGDIKRKKPCDSH